MESQSDSDKNRVDGNSLQKVLRSYFGLWSAAVGYPVSAQDGKHKYWLNTSMMRANAMLWTKQCAESCISTGQGKQKPIIVDSAVINKRRNPHRMACDNGLQGFCMDLCLHKRRYIPPLRRLYRQAGEIWALGEVYERGLRGMLLGPAEFYRSEHQRYQRFRAELGPRTDLYAMGASRNVLWNFSALRISVDRQSDYNSSLRQAFQDALLRSGATVAVSPDFGI